MGSGLIRARRHCSAGQALVELALVVPILILIVASIAQLGMIFERQIGIENAVREAARRGATLPTDSSNVVSNAGWTRDQLVTLLNNNPQTYDPAKDQLHQACYETGAADPSGNTLVVTVRVRYLHPVFLPLISIILDGIDGTADGGLRVDTSSTFRVEQPNSAGGTPVCAA